MKPKIKEIRESRGITQTHIADKMKIKTLTLRRWEKGETFPDIRQANELAALLFVKVDDLYEEKE